EYETGYAEKQRQRNPGFFAHCALAAFSGFKLQFFRLEPREGLLAHLLQRCVDFVNDVVVRPVDGGARLRDRYAGFETCEQVKKVITPVLERVEAGNCNTEHRCWHEHLRRCSYGCSMEDLWRDSGGCDRLTIND